MGSPGLSPWTLMGQAFPATLAAAPPAQSPPQLCPKGLTPVFLSAFCTV